MLRHVFIMLLLAGNISAQNSETPHWSPALVSGLRLSLDDSHLIEDLDFGPTGMVRATFGIKDGYATGPVYQWKIVEDRLLIIDEDAHRNVEEFRLLAWGTKTVRVQRPSGEILTFTVQH